ncbi:MAG: helix-turn-helix domain-containing protein [Solirubrobacteraceae bacterium]
MMTPHRLLPVSETAAWVARRIKEARTARGYSQAELARRLGRTQTALSLWEAGKRMPGLDDLMDLARGLDHELGFFFPPDEIRQPIAMLLRGTAERIAGRELEQLLDELLAESDRRGLPTRQIEIGATSPARAADELLQKADVQEPPVPVSDLAKLCGILVIPRSMSDELSGLVFDMDHAAVIAVNSQHSENRQRFSTAHELGHHLLRHHDRFHIDVTEGDAPGYDWLSERAANEFAAELLMPREMILDEFKRIPDTHRLATRFKVSEIAMGYRLLNLGLR